MPIIKSAKKRVRKARRATVRNLRTKRNLKTAIKSLQKAIEGGKKVTAEELKQAQSAIDQAVKKNIVHKNKAARQKSRLVRLAKAAGNKPVTKKAVTKKPASKPAAKKPTPKKTPKTKK